MDGETHRIRDDVDRARLSAEAGRVLGSSLHLGTTLRRVAELAVPRMADWCVVELLEDGALVELALAHRDPARADLVGRLRRDYPPDPASEAGPWSVIRSGQPRLVPIITREMLLAFAKDARHGDMLAELGLTSYLAVPLQGTESILGVLTLARGEEGPAFTKADLAMVVDLAGRAAGAVANAQAYRVADRFRRILDAVGEAVFVIDPSDGAVREVNARATELLGAPKTDLVGRPFWDAFDESSAEGVRDRLEAIESGAPTPGALQVPLRRADGSTVAVEVLLQCMTLPGEPERWIATARDIGERLKIASRLQKLADQEHARAAELNAVIRAIGDGVVVCAPDGRITLANPAGEALFPDIQELTYADILGQLADPEGVAPNLGRQGGPTVLPTVGSPDRWIEVSTYPVAPHAADPARAGGGETIVVLRDVTEARQREALRETFIGVLSHELRTPVTTIYGGAKILARDGSTIDEATRRTIFLDIAAESERLQRLVEDVVALNRFGQDGGDLGHEPVLLQRVVPSVVGSEEPRWPEVSFRSEVPPGLPTVVADPTYVEQVLRNLVSNAAKYVGFGSEVEILVEAAEDEVLVRVLDDGPGFAAEETDRLFDLFYRAPSTAKSATGAGIGLFVCARLIAAMGGRIWARRRPAGGAEFGFALRVMTEG